MKRFLTILLALFLLVMTMPALAENSEWEFDESKCTLTRYTGAGGEVAVPEKIGSAAVKTLDTGVLAQVSGMTSLTLPETVLHIKDNAGSWNPDLVRLSLPQSLMIIGSNGFNDCDALESVTIPAGGALYRQRRVFGQRPSEEHYLRGRMPDVRRRILRLSGGRRYRLCAGRSAGSLSGGFRGHGH